MTRPGKPRFVIRQSDGAWWVYCVGFGRVCPSVVWVHYLGQGIWKNYLGKEVPA